MGIVSTTSPQIWQTGKLIIAGLSGGPDRSGSFRCRHVRLRLAYKDSGTKLVLKDSRFTLMIHSEIRQCDHVHWGAQFETCQIL
jgi:hypothetical protein